MLQVTVDDAEEADKLFRILMGEDVMSRKHFYPYTCKERKRTRRVVDHI